jgi:hypothetical protein
MPKPEEGWLVVSLEQAVACAPKRKQLSPPGAAFQVFLKRRPDALSTVFTRFPGSHRLA